jgi:hypothetical protein
MIDLVHLNSLFYLKDKFFFSDEIDGNIVFKLVLIINKNQNQKQKIIR